MKYRQAIYAFFTFSLLLAIGNTAWAQEESQGPVPPAQTEERESGDPLISGEGSQLPEVDSKVIRPAITPPKEKETEKPSTKGKGNEATAAKKNEDDALSFNFLYYIIQKFKISDLIEN
jgi:hypothetical protein